MPGPKVDLTLRIFWIFLVAWFLTNSREAKLKKISYFAQPQTENVLVKLEQVVVVSLFIFIPETTLLKPFK